MVNFSELLPLGTSAIIQRKVHETDTAVHHGSGALACLLATPAYTDLMILAAIEAVESKLPEGFITVGLSMEFTHEAPTGQGLTVSIKASLVEVDGNRLTFDIIACDEISEIGHGQHVRAIVNREQFLKKAKERMDSVERRSPRQVPN